MSDDGRAEPCQRIRVGTSGFDYAHWDGPFYPADLPASERLAWYAARFDTVELNVTFYRMPAASSFERWRDAVPPGFLFAVKASRYLTHVRRLDAPRGPVEFLMDRASRLGDRLGPVLLQLPPSMKVDLDRLEATLEAFGAATRVAVEPRHASWFTDDFAAVLRRHRAAMCLVDRRGLRTPLWRTAPWLYVRLHEGRARPPSCYGRDAIRSWARRLPELAPGAPAPSEAKGGQVRPGSPGRCESASGFVYFNNDAHACAVANAATLRLRLSRTQRGAVGA